MQENVIISFTSDSSDLDQSINKFKQLSTEEKKFREESKKAEEQVKKQGQTTKQVTDQQQKSLASLAKQYGNMDKAIANGAAFTSMRSAIKELTQEMALLELQGKQDTEEFRNLRAVAGELVDTMDAVRGRIKDAASDTNKLDGVVAMAESVAAGFSLAQGAAALFGASSKDLEKALVPLQGAMAVLMGLTSLQNAIQKESIQMRVIENIQTRAGAAAVRLETSAKSGNIVVSKGATAAQWLLNAAMNANPVLLLVTGVGLLVAALSAFVLMGESAAEKQEKLNKQLEAGEERFKRLREASARVYGQLDKDIDYEIERMKAQGRSLEDIIKLESIRATLSKQAANAQKQTGDVTAQNLEETKTGIEGINKALDEFTNGNKKKTVTVNIEGKVVKYKLKDDEQRKSLEDLRDQLQEKVNFYQDASEKELDIDRAQSLKQIEDQKKLNESRMRGTVAFYEAVAIKAREGTFKEYQAQVSAAKAKASLDIEGVQTSNNSENEKANLILKINAQLHKDLRALRDAYNIEQITRQKNYVDAELALVTEGTKRELDLKISSITKQRDADLIAAKDNSSKKKLIEANYQKDKVNLEKEYNNRIFDNTITAEEAKVNARLSAVEKGSKEEFSLNERLLQLKADADTEAVRRSIDSEANKALRIAAINKKLNADILDMHKQRILAQRDAEVGNMQQSAAFKEMALEKKVTETKWFEFGKRNDLYKQQVEAKKNAIYDEQMIVEQNYNDGLITQQEYDSKASDLAMQRAEIDAETRKKQEENRKQAEQMAFDTMSFAMNSYFDSKKERLQQDLEAIHNSYTTDAQEAKTSASKKLITESELAKRQIDIKRQIAKVDKEQAIFNAIIGTSTAVINALNTNPFMPFGPIMAAIALAKGTIEINAIKNRPLPKYWKGRKSGKGEWARVGEYGPEDVYIPNGAAIIPSHHSRTLAEADRIMDSYNIPDRNYSLRSARRAMGGNSSNSNSPIDYDKLGDAIASRINNNSVQVSLDRNGYNTYLNEGNTRTRIMNNNYTLSLS